jgi:hypothetical protein
LNQSHRRQWGDGTDIRCERLDDRRAKLGQLLTRPDGIRFSEDLDGDGDGEVMFRHACKLGLRRHRQQASRCAVPFRAVAAR